MPSHYHLLNRDSGRQPCPRHEAADRVSTQLFNKRHSRNKAILIQKSSHLLDVRRYVVLNPVRARMVERSEDWKWSIYLATAGREKPHASLTTDWVLRQFSGKREKAEKEYHQYASRGIGKSIWTGVRSQALLGEEGLVDKLADHLKKHRDIPEIRGASGIPTGPLWRSCLLRELSGTRRCEIRRSVKLLRGMVTVSARSLIIWACISPLSAGS